MNSEEGCIICAVATFLVTPREGPHANDPVMFIEKLKQICYYFVPESKEDAEEFLHCLLESLRNQYLVSFSKSLHLDRISKKTTPENSNKSVQEEIKWSLASVPRADGKFIYLHINYFLIKI